MNYLRAFFLASAFCLSAVAQNGDRAGEVQTPPPIHLVIPPAPPLSPEEALNTFKLVPGFKVELVASEPLIEAPVAMQFDPNGRLFVLEMRGFMQTVDGANEEKPTGRISMLEDLNDDGRMDKATVFADGLVMPRAMVLVRGGLLVAEPPHLWFFKDTNGDGKSDEKTEVSSDYGNQSNPEHNANGLLWARDNWIYSANHAIRYRNTDGTWQKEVTTFRGQWGLTQDDYGRLFFNSNSDPFRGDFSPAQYLLRNPNYKTAFGGNIQIERNLEVFPGRVNPGVNRGYQKGQLREDGTLRTFTGACGPLIYRGELFPKELYGAGFLCEPTGNFVRCEKLTEQDGMISATNAFGGTEFLTSTDERFRPVNLYNGPDGGLYVVDMYRGVIQHKIYLTTYLRKQALERQLENPVNLGRIYRVVPANAKRTPVPKLAALSSKVLVEELKHLNGWRRDTAQQLLIEKGGRTDVSALYAVLREGKFPAAVHALWVLAGMDNVTVEAALLGLGSADPKVRATAIRYSEPFVRAEGSNPVRQKVLAAVKDPSADVQLQAMFTLGESRAADAEAALIELLDARVDHPLIRSAAVSGLNSRELPVLERLLALPDWSENTRGREVIVRELARCITEAREPVNVSRLLELAAAQNQPWRRISIVNGIMDLVPPLGKSKTPQPVKPIRFESEPAGLAKLRTINDSAVALKMPALDALIVWKGKPGFVEVEVKPLTTEEKVRFDTGKELYTAICGACHQPTGLGLDGLAPPLVDTEWTTGSPDRLARIVLHGVRGPLNVKGRTWQLEMPPLNILSDEQIAAIMTYVRREWGHTASPVEPSFVEKVRKETESREEAWTEAELLKVQ